MKMNAWNVFVGRKCIDTVFYTANCDADYVRRSLINHDGYPWNIVIKRSK
jgi:hypothetical protein